MSGIKDVDGIRYDYTNVMAEVVGTENGLTESELTSLAPDVTRHHEAMVVERSKGGLAFMGLPGRRDYAEQAMRYASENASRFENVVVLGIGGSALGMIALQTALNHPYYNLLGRKERGGPRLFVVDNIDPALISGLLDVVDPSKTLFNVITKSGQTAETMSQLMLVTGLLRRRLGKKMGEHVVATTDPAKGVMRKIVEAEGWTNFEVPDGVGGRFSVLSPVGLVPAALVGIDVGRLLAGAAAMDARLRTGNLMENPAYLGAVIHHLLDVKHGKPVAVMMSYSHQLRDVADWFGQLWAESLGKAKSLDGKPAHVGQTPVKAVGVTDQHSQVQLYVEGPSDKLFTFLAVEEPSSDVTIPKEYVGEDACGYLAGRTFGELFDAERKGTRIALTEAGRPNVTLSVPRVEAETVGALFYLLEVQTAMAGRLYHINAFDQPGVEAGKVAAYALMGRQGYEKRAGEIRDRLQSVKPRVV